MDLLKPPHEKLGGICYLPRMLAKIRAQLGGRLPEKYQGWYGRGMDERCADFFRVPFATIERWASEAADETVLQLLRTHGRAINDNDIDLWNGFMMKRGWRDSMTEMLREDLAERGWSGRRDLVTLFEFYDADENRPQFEGLLE